MLEDIVDGLVKNLSRVAARMQQAAGTTVTYAAAGGNIQLPGNNTLEFTKSFSDGLQEQSTLQITAAATVEGECVVTLNGEDFVLPVSISSINNTATELAVNISGIEGYTATATTDTVTIVSDLPGIESDLAFAADSLAATAVTTVDGTTGTAANAQLTISEKEDWLAAYYVTGKKDRLNMDFTVQAKFETKPTITKNVGDTGHGTGYHVRNMEYYFKGNRGDTMRGMGYPNNFEQSYDSVLTDEYFLIELGYFSEGRDDAMKSKKQLTIALPSKAAANTMIAELNTALTNTSFSVAVFA